MESRSATSPALVALAGWILPGAGYFFLGQRARGITIGVTIIILFMSGLLIGGVRVIDVPGYDDQGHPLMIPIRDASNRPLFTSDRKPLREWVMKSSPLSEVREKPWSIAQVLTGPIGVMSGWWSVNAARPVSEGGSAAPESHAHVHDIGTLYTAVAGMLNLLAIIDAASRAASIAAAASGRNR